MNPCSFCGKEQIECANSAGKTVLVDACLGGALVGGEHDSFCCGHGNLSKAYARVSVRRPDGEIVKVDLCGVIVQGYGSFRSPSSYVHSPPSNVNYPYPGMRTP